MAWHEILLILIAGLSTGAINTLAGSGSLITLPLLISLGLPADVANGTNRVGVLLQTAIAVPTMQRKNPVSLKGAWWILVSGMAGAIVGAELAIDLSEEAMHRTIAALMVLMLFVILLKPSRWLKDGVPNPGARKNPLYWLLFFAMGVYGGFIQAGIGIFLLAGLVVGVGYNLIHANIIKLFFVAVYTLPILFRFHMTGKVNWEMGLMLAAGQVVGAYAAARFASGNPNARVWIRRLLILVVVASIIKLFVPMFL